MYFKEFSIYCLFSCIKRVVCIQYFMLFLASVRKNEFRTLFQLLIYFRMGQNSSKITLHLPSRKLTPFWLNASHRNSSKKDYALLQLHSVTVNKARSYCNEQKSSTPCKKQKTVATEKYKRRRQVSSVLDYGQRTFVPCTKKSFVNRLCVSVYFQNSDSLH